MIDNKYAENEIQGVATQLPWQTVIHSSIYDKKTYNFIVDFITPQL